ncbi:stalk domain-containing protein [Paenibacillus thiaminolyticus]|uniref:stalk domain-containing protein n=1 Tax=Paenibacillus thiaminolyticus TaxID=49283 RepID=UPI00116597EC|nr:stalk domain-containing protein [Paenibacillus thiaminolyticus]NGP60682.1 hypothetical protein [Paenibacillus thiaminolyticus]WCR25698.1 stalk domain-containing protein [Paenibacillus thiaminolyticus]
MKKFIIGFLCGAIFFSGISYAASGDLNAKTSNAKIFINKEEQYMRTKPVIINNTTYLPLRELSDITGYHVGVKEGDIYLSLTRYAIDSVNNVGFTPLNYHLYIDNKLQKDVYTLTIGNRVMATSNILLYLWPLTQWTTDSVTNEHVYISKLGEVRYLQESDMINVNGKDIRVSQAPKKIGGSVYLPLEDVVKALGYQINFDQKLLRIDIGSKLKKQQGFQTEQREDSLFIKYSTDDEDDLSSQYSANDKENTVQPVEQGDNISTAPEQTVQNDVSGKIIELRSDYEKLERYINSQIQAIQSEYPLASRYSDEKYDELILGLSKEKLDIQSKRNVLALDDSREAKAKKEKYSQQIDSLQQQIEDLQKEQKALARINAMKQQLAERKQIVDQAIAELRK